MPTKRASSFKKVVVCHTNDFKPGVNDKIKTWVEANGGTCEKALTPDVTHLVSSELAWKRCEKIVKDARRMRTIFIVKYDWLEDSLMKKPVRALPVEKYLWEQTKFDLVKRVENARKKAKAVSIKRPPSDSDVKPTPKLKRVHSAGINLNLAVKEFEKDMRTVGYHPYCDKTGFTYVINLLRHDIHRNLTEQYALKVGCGPPSLPYNILPRFYTPLYFLPTPGPFSAAPVVCTELAERLNARSCIHLAKPWAQCLQLFESDQLPYTYACYAQFTRPAAKTAMRVLAPPGSTWSFTWQMFEKFFKMKVGTKWEQRDMNGAEINLDGGADSELWQYQVPNISQLNGLSSENALQSKSRNSQVVPDTSTGYSQRDDNGVSIVLANTTLVKMDVESATNAKAV